MKYSPFLLSLTLPLAGFATVNSSLGFETGFGFDAISQNDLISTGFSSYKYKRIWTYDVGLNARLDICNVYLLAEGTYRALLTAPHLYTSLDGDVLTRAQLKREDGYDAGLRIGYSRAYSNLLFSPEVGFSLSSLQMSDNLRLSVGAPFVGFQMDWRFVRYWRLNTYFNYSFLGYRREDLASNATATNVEKISRGSFSGPAGGLAFGYSYVDKWEILFGFNAKYLESTRAVWPTNATSQGGNTTWLRLNSHIEITYNF